MRITLQANPRMWAHVPAAYPTGEFATMEEWSASIVDRYAESRPEASNEYEAVRLIACGASEVLSDTASFGLLFWPFPTPLATLVQVELGPPLQPTDNALSVLLGDIPVSVQPQVETVQLPVGDGIAARFLVIAPDTQEPMAGIGYLLSTDQSSIRVLSSPTTTTMVGLLDPPLRDVVATMVITD